VTVGSPVTLKAFLDGLGQHGWVDGQNVKVEMHLYGSDVDRVSAMLGEVLALGCDVLLAGTPYAGRAARRATWTVPIVGIDLESDPVAEGFVTSLARRNRDEKWPWPGGLPSTVTHGVGYALLA